MSTVTCARASWPPAHPAAAPSSSTPRTSGSHAPRRHRDGVACVAAIELPSPTDSPDCNRGGAAMAQLRSVATTEPSRAELAALRRLLDQAFEGRFSEDDWRHTVGGL